MHIFGEVYRMFGSCVYMLMCSGNLHIFPYYTTTTVFYNVVYSKLILVLFNITFVANDQPRGLAVRVSDYQS